MIHMIMKNEKIKQVAKLERVKVNKTICTFCLHLCYNYYVNILSHKSYLTFLQIQMNSPDVLLVHIKS
jgi:hypothetical protein